MPVFGLCFSSAGEVSYCAFSVSNPLNADPGDFHNKTRHFSTSALPIPSAQYHFFFDRMVLALCARVLLPISLLRLCRISVCWEMVCPVLIFVRYSLEWPRLALRR